MLDIIVVNSGKDADIMNKIINKTIEKIKDVFDIIYWKCRFTYSDIRMWFRYNFNKTHLNLIKTAWLSYSFDFSYMYVLEQAKLKEMYEYFKNAKILEKSNYDVYIRDISICIRLLDIILENIDLDQGYINTRNWKRFLYNDIYKMTEHKCAGKSEKEIEKIQLDAANELKWYLRNIKATRLYYKIRLYKLESWWD